MKSREGSGEVRGDSGQVDESMVILGEESSLSGRDENVADHLDIVEVAKMLRSSEVVLDSDQQRELQEVFRQKDGLVRLLSQLERYERKGALARSYKALQVIDDIFIDEDYLRDLPVNTLIRLRRALIDGVHRLSSVEQGSSSGNTYVFSPVFGSDAITAMSARERVQLGKIFRELGAKLREQKEQAEAERRMDVSEAEIVAENDQDE